MIIRMFIERLLTYLYVSEVQILVHCKKLMAPLSNLITCMKTLSCCWIDVVFAFQLERSFSFGLCWRGPLVKEMCNKWVHWPYTGRGRSGRCMAKHTTFHCIRTPPTHRSLGVGLRNCCSPCSSSSLSSSDLLLPLPLPSLPLNAKMMTELLFTMRY